MKINRLILHAILSYVEKLVRDTHVDSIVERIFRDDGITSEGVVFHLKVLLDEGYVSFTPFILPGEAQYIDRLTIKGCDLLDKLRVEWMERNDKDGIVMLNKSDGRIRLMRDTSQRLTQEDITKAQKLLDNLQLDFNRINE